MAVTPSRYRLRFEDGDERVVSARPCHRLALERHVAKVTGAGETLGIEEKVLFGLWQADGAPDTFDAWVADLTEYERVVEELADPSSQSTESSPD